MKILVINHGSSSIKCCLYYFPKLPNQFVPPIWEKKIEWKNFDQEGFCKIKKDLLSLLSDKTIDCIGHRIVHGGKIYIKSTFINDSVKKEIIKISSLAPLHNKADIQGIEISEKIFPSVPQIAVFDTAFHHTLPEYVKIYPGPYEWFKMGIQRFGFHGISFQYCTKRSQEILGRVSQKMVICHLGSGASLCALKDGKSIDTTMGLTPLEGLMMDTRSGTIDPGILLYLLEKKGKTSQDLSEELYKKSGLLGLSGISSDMRDILEKTKAGNLQAKLSIDVYVYKLVSFIGSMVASLDGIDTLIFTAGIGENASFIREQVCSRLSFLGIDLLKNHPSTENDAILSSTKSKVSVLVIHTQEAFEIARECFKKMKNID